MRNNHITASNSALESPSAAKFNALTFKVIEKLQKGGRWRNYQDPFGSVLGLREGGCQTWHYRFPWKIIISLQVMVWWDAHQQPSSLQSNMRLLGLFRRERWRHYQDIFGSDLGMGCAPFPCVHTTSGFQVLTGIVGTWYESRTTVMMRLGHEKSPITRT